MTPFWPPARRARTVLSLNKDAGVSPGCDTLLEPFRAAAANAMEGLDLPNVIYRFASGVLVVALAAVLGGCSNPAGSTSSVTDTFNGTVGSTGFDSHSFTVNNSGDVDATLTALQPQTTITVGFGIGQPTSTGCSLASYSESARVGSVLSGTISPGTHCVTVYDVGNIQGSDSYTVTVSHP